MKRFIKTLFLAGLPFGIAMGLIFSIMEQNISIGVFVALFSGIAFGLLMSLFQNHQLKKLALINPTIPNLLFSDAANHFVNKESVGGFLLLTTTQLIFKAHALNINTQEFVIELKDIIEVKEVLTLGVIPNGLLISTNTSKEQFVVFGRKIWISKILETKSKL